MTTTTKTLLTVPILAILGVLLQNSISEYGVRGSEDADKVFKVAIQRMDISICDKIHLKSFADMTNQELRAGCYREYAHAFPDAHVCLHLFNAIPPKGEDGYTPALVQHALCVTEEAKGARDAGLCFQIKEADFTTLCIKDVAFQNKDPNLCEILPNVLDKKSCLEYLHF